MTYIDIGMSGYKSQTGGRLWSSAHSVVTEISRKFSAGPKDRIVLENVRTRSEVTPREGRLEELQRLISSYHNYLPEGFAVGLNGQFANMLADDAWEDGDVLPSIDSLKAFLLMLSSMNVRKRPGVGTNGRGSITAFWRSDDNRLTIDCLPSGNTRWVLTRINANGQVERAAAECKPHRLRDVLKAYGPEVWIGQ